MHVDYVKTLHKEDAPVAINGQCVSDTNPPAWIKGTVDLVEPIAQRYCCEAMEKQVLRGYIGFGTRPEITYHNHAIDVFIRVEGGPANDIPLAYCPWCTAPVETHEVATI